MSRRSKTVQTTETIAIDVSTGEMLSNQSVKTGSKEVEPNFVKLYLDDIGRLHDLPPYASKLMQALVKTAGYNNIVPMYRPVKELICKDINMKMNTLNKAVQMLAQAGVLISMGQGRGLYMLDPNLFGKGRWEDIKRLRLCVDYDRTTGERRINGEVVKQLEMKFT
jgi:Firmicute plasmid replication protein (RepL)